MSETYHEKVQNVISNTKKNALNNKKETNVTVSLSEEEIKWAEKTIPLIHNEQFKGYLELENLCLLEVMTTAYLPPPEAMFKSSSFGENMAFKAGMDAALKRLKHRREQIWHTYLVLKEKQKKEKEQGNG